MLEETIWSDLGGFTKISLLRYWNFPEKGFCFIWFLQILIFEFCAFWSILIFAVMGRQNPGKWLRNLLLGKKSSSKSKSSREKDIYVSLYLFYFFRLLCLASVFVYDSLHSMSIWKTESLTGQIYRTH